MTAVAVVLVLASLFRDVNSQSTEDVTRLHDDLLGRINPRAIPSRYVDYLLSLHC